MTWASAPAFPIVPRRYGLPGGAPGLTVQPREGLGLATLLTAPGEEAALAAVVRELWALDLPGPRRSVQGPGRALVWSGPGHWLAVLEAGPVDDPAAQALARACAFSDQSGSRALLHLSGPRVREVLAKGCPVDLDGRAFGPGDVAQTLIAHVGVQIWQVDATPSFAMTVPRSLVGSVWSWLEASAAEFGCEVLPS